MASNENNLDAAERALGTEPRRHETATERREREAWEQRLAPLLDPSGDVSVPDGMYERIQDRIADRGEVIALRRTRRRAGLWRATAGVMAAVAATLAFLVVAPLINQPPAERFIALVTSDEDGRVGLVVQFDTASQTATVVPVNLSPPENSSLELWHLPEGATSPISRGLMPDGPVERATFVANPGDVFAISLEPKGGSPTGQPTQPIYHGKFEPVR